MIRTLVIATALAATIAAMPEAAGQTTSEEQALLQFQRAADTYALQHRHAERQLGGTPSQGAMAAELKVERTVPGEGMLFTPLATAAFRNRIQLVLSKGRCAGPVGSESSIVPRPNAAATGTVALSECVVAALPKLPPELGYRAAGVALLLIDVHAGLVVDVMHGAFPLKND